MSQSLTVCCKLEVSESLRQELEATLQAFAQACNLVQHIAETNHTINKLKLQHISYREIRERFGLSANLTIRAIARVASRLKAGHTQPVFRPTSVDYDQRIFRFREADWAVSLTLLAGARYIPLVIGAFQRDLLAGQSPTSAKLVKRKNGDFYLHIAVTHAPPTSSEPNGFLGVDLGMRNIASLSTGEHFDGEANELIRNRYRAIRRVLQKKGTKGAKRLLKRLSGKEKRYAAWLNHTISARIVRFAKCHGMAVVLEDLRGIRQRTRVRKDQRVRHHRWAFFQLRQFMAYKCRRQGVSMVLVNPAYTSKTCHRCLCVGKRGRDSFDCGYCGFSGHADHNAACVIAALGASITRPEHSLSCQMARQ